MLDVRPGSSRASTTVPGGTLRHAFSAGRHYDAANTSFGPLVLHDEVELAAGAGFPDHPHAGVAVVTHVLSGALRHRDALGTDVVLGPGDTGVMTTGAGLVHAEHATAAGPALYLQAFLLDDGAAAHAVHRGAHQVEVGSSVLRVLRLRPGSTAVLVGPRLHLHLVEGELEVGEPVDGPSARPHAPSAAGPAPLQPGDAVRATGRLALRARTRALALAWALA